jgi:hypothetical protein
VTNLGGRVKQLAQKVKDVEKEGKKLDECSRKENLKH